MKQNKLKILKQFISDNSDAPVQGTQAWLQGRMYTVGGSEISSIVGCNPFSTMEQLVSQKTGLTKFTGNAATRWGNLFENISELLFKTLFIESNAEKENKIYATGGIQHSTILNHKYSPDGLCVLPFEGEYKITLLEFKSPFSSVPSGTVPKHYVPQVKAGLCTIDITETAVFVNNMFRKCSLEQLDFGLEYDTSYHKDTVTKMRGIEAAPANGVILIYIKRVNMVSFTKHYREFIDGRVDEYIGNFKFNNESNTNNSVTDNEFVTGYGSDDSDDDETIEEIRARFMCNDGSSILYDIQDAMSSGKLIDFGKMGGNLFNQFLELYKSDNTESFLDIKCVKPQINNLLLQKKSKNFIIPNELNYVRDSSYIMNICKQYNFGKIIDKFLSRCRINGDVPIGYLPWKLLKGSNIVVEKEPGYLDLHKEKIDTVIDIVKAINIEETDMEKIKKFQTYFVNTELGDALYEEAAIKNGSLREFFE